MLVFAIAQKKSKVLFKVVKVMQNTDIYAPKRHLQTPFDKSLLNTVIYAYYVTKNQRYCPALPDLDPWLAIFSINSRILSWFILNSLQFKEIFGK